MIDVSYTVTIRVQGMDEKECWRLFQEKLENGEGEIRTQEMFRDPEHVISTSRRETIIPAKQVDTLPPPAGRNGDTIPCNGVVKVNHNLQIQQR